MKRDLETALLIQDDWFDDPFLSNLQDEGWLFLQSQRGVYEYVSFVGYIRMHQIYYIYHLFRVLN